MNIKPASPDDIIRWPDGSWCYRHELHEYTWMGDDYEVLTPEHPEYDLITEAATS
jgi:hypothetical protein